MTYCLGIKVESGLVALADTRITSGSSTTTGRKIYTSQHEGRSLFLMTSGLRSVRDKALTYFREAYEHNFGQYDKVYQAANLFGDQIKRVAVEDKEQLTRSGLAFNLHTIIGGQFHEDEEHKLYLLYPEGNWIEIGVGSPFMIIGNEGYGKPVLNRTITYQSSMEFALKTGFLSFDSTRVSANDVGYPIDVMLYPKNSFSMAEQRFEEHELRNISLQWGSKLEDAINTIPGDWMTPVFQRMKEAQAATPYQPDLL